MTAGDVVTLDGSASEPWDTVLLPFVGAVGRPVGRVVQRRQRRRRRSLRPHVASSDGSHVSSHGSSSDEGLRRGSDFTVVTVQPKPVAALATALALFDSTLAPASANTIAVNGRLRTGDRGAFSGSRRSAARSLVGGARRRDFERSRRGGSNRVPRRGARAAERTSGCCGDVAGQIESFGFLLLGQVAEARDPALHDAIDERMRDALLPEDPAALLSGRSKVVDTGRVEIQSVADPAAASAHSIDRLLAVRSVCVQSATALDVTAAGFRVIADAARRD